MAAAKFAMIIFGVSLLFTAVLGLQSDDVRDRISRLREVIDECACPTSCIFRLKMCLESGECSACRVATYGKRAKVLPPTPFRDFESPAASRERPSIFSLY